MHRHHHWSRRRGGCWDFSPAYAWAHSGSDEPESRGAEFYFSVGRGGDDDMFGAAGLGVRRPLRFLSWKLDLGPDQVAAVARILERLKIERAQAEVELRRSASAIADAFAADAFDAAATSVATEHRAESAKNVQAAVARALGELHSALEPDQRKKLAMLIRTRAITF
ncbi:MAG TPA: Spy/CpxP family protein refolding chaperone [Myxococcota bacterium]|nr:Spy/CpxP family protein refolding chaperone [Myxococcota bacterium]